MEFIVAEVSKNWRGPACPTGTASGHVCRLFEEIINYNRDRGYALHSWQLHRMMTGPEVLNETIVAVFAKAKG